MYRFACRAPTARLSPRTLCVEPVSVCRPFTTLAGQRLRSVAVRRILAPELFGDVSVSASGASSPAKGPLVEKLMRRWHRIMHRLLPLGGASEGNEVTVYNDGDEAFREMWKAIDSAKERVLFETYIIAPDNVGLEMLSRLAAAARRGCRVTVIYDAFGSYRIRENHLAELKSLPNVQVISFNPMLQWPRRSLWFRDHRKILIVDGVVGFTGGMNTAKEYAGSELGGSDPNRKCFRDTHIKIQGPAVAHLADVFLDSVHEAVLLDTLTQIPKWLISLQQWRDATIRKTTQKAASAFNRIFLNVFEKARQREEDKTAAQRAAANLIIPSAEKIRKGLHWLDSTVARRTEQLIAERQRRLEEKKGRRNELLMAESSARDAVREADLAAAHQQQQNSLAATTPAATGSSDVTSIASQQSAVAEAAAAAGKKGVFAQVLRSNVLQNSLHIQRSLIETLDRCGVSVRITNPFLVPPASIARAIIRAASRGVDVQIITGGRSDTPYMRWAATHIYHIFLKAGVRIFEYQPKILHAKTVTIDGVFSAIGSFNLDYLSSVKNLEVQVLLVDKKVANTLERQFEEDAKHCQEITLQSLADRNLFAKLLHWACYKLCRLLTAYRVGKMEV